MIYANRSTTTIRALTPRASRERLECPANRRHDVRMDHERHHGVTTGRMVAWCYECRAVVPPASETAVVITEADRACPERPRRAPRYQPTESADLKARNAAIRPEWAHGEKRHTLAARYGITRERVTQIIFGRRKSA